MFCGENTIEYIEWIKNNLFCELKIIKPPWCVVVSPGFSFRLGCFAPVLTFFYHKMLSSFSVYPYQNQLQCRNSKKGETAVLYVKCNASYFWVWPENMRRVTKNLFILGLGLFLIGVYCELLIYYVVIIQVNYYYFITCYDPVTITKLYYLKNKYTYWKQNL